jgi:hypothetical protein
MLSVFRRAKRSLKAIIALTMKNRTCIQGGEILAGTVCSGTELNWIQAPAPAHELEAAAKTEGAR